MGGWGSPKKGVAGGLVSVGGGGSKRDKIAGAMQAVLAFGLACSS